MNAIFSPTGANSSDECDDYDEDDGSGTPLVAMDLVDIADAFSATTVALMDTEVDERAPMLNRS